MGCPCRNKGHVGTGAFARSASEASSENLPFRTPTLPSIHKLPDFLNMPPSMKWVLPVTYAAASEAR